MTTIERNVGIDPHQELYVIKSEAGVTTLGFDVVMDRVERYALNLAMTLHPTVVRGSRQAYDTMVLLQDLLHKHFEATGEKAVADLSPQLVGLEGHRVEVCDEPGDEPRRFIVGKSMGWLPVHLEISRTSARGGPPARPEYASVRDLGRVR